MKQIFNDGNKRTAQLLGNKILIEHGCGIISVPEAQLLPFKNMVIDFYETNNMEPLKEFVYEECIDGMTFARDKSLIEPCPEKSNQLADSNGKNHEVEK